MDIGAQYLYGGLSQAGQSIGGGLKQLFDNLEARKEEAAKANAFANVLGKTFEDKEGNVFGVPKDQFMGMAAKDRIAHANAAIFASNLKNLQTQGQVEQHNLDASRLKFDAMPLEIAQAAQARDLNIEEQQNTVRRQEEALRSTKEGQTILNEFAAKLKSAPGSTFAEKFESTLSGNPELMVRGGPDFQKYALGIKELSRSGPIQPQEWKSPTGGERFMIMGNNQPVQIGAKALNPEQEAKARKDTAEAVKLERENALISGAGALDQSVLSSYKKDVADAQAEVHKWESAIADNASLGAKAGNKGTFIRGIPYSKKLEDAKAVLSAKQKLLEKYTGAVPAAPAQEQMIDMINPNGVRGKLPASKVDAALKLNPPYKHANP